MGYLIQKCDLQFEDDNLLLCPVCEQNCLTFGNLYMRKERIEIEYNCQSCEDKRVLVLKNHKGVSQMFFMTKNNGVKEEVEKYLSL